MQNQWFFDPPRIQKAMASATDPVKYRKRLLSYALFSGCKSGRMLRQHLGDKWCDRIIWENASDRIGDCASSVFPADMKHLKNLVGTEQPDIIVGFGKVACNAFLGDYEEHATVTELLWHGAAFAFVATTHPTARGERVGGELQECARELDRLERKYLRDNS